MIYFDCAATSWPKPEAVYRAVDHCLREVGANPGRSGHQMSVEAERIVLTARANIAELLGVEDEARIILTFNTTDALNLAIKGILRPKDHVITTSIEHNSVMRPLRSLEKQGLITVTVIRCNSQGFFAPSEIEKNIQSNTRLVTVTHASNVIGSIQPVEEIGQALKKYPKVYYLVDAAQTAGIFPVNVKDIGAHLLAFPGHKGLLGPQGTGGLYVAEGVEDVLVPLKQGGTGSKSEYELHPDILPDKYESGTKNTPGLAGLAAGVEFILSEGREKIQKHEQTLTAHLLNKLQEIDEVIIYGPQDALKQTAVVSINVKDMSPSDVGYYLDHEYSVMTRVGLHCAPTTHKTIGTAPSGTVRLSMGYFNTIDEIDYVCRSLKEIVGKYRGK
ncbi:MAG: aminotransferase class V-fold PLP-dependent enzyme [Candidatus Schekmanbacteria bacterium]|nr:aminotransferase class V-fold PLP-dependent enzyme [Candidatus Schekmanbacteria bacterium]